MMNVENSCFVPVRRQDNLRILISICKKLLCYYGHSCVKFMFHYIVNLLSQNLMTDMQPTVYLLCNYKT